MAADAVRSARELSVQYPVADALEAAAAVAERVGPRPRTSRHCWRRRRGLGPRRATRSAPLRGRIEALRGRVGATPDPGPNIAGACDLAERILVADRVG